MELRLPRRSVLVLQGNGSDVCRHCVPRVSAPRLSVTLRMMRSEYARAIDEQRTLAPLPRSLVCALTAHGPNLPPQRPVAAPAAAAPATRSSAAAAGSANGPGKPAFSWAAAVHGSTAAGAPASSSAAPAPAPYAPAGSSTAVHLQTGWAQPKAPPSACFGAAVAAGAGGAALVDKGGFASLDPVATAWEPAASTRAGGAPEGRPLHAAVYVAPLKVFSMSMPFAALLVNGVKTIETR